MANEPASFNISKLQSEAQQRWLKPSEILFILQNHRSCKISERPAIKPQSGSLLLFNRRVLRFFRKDGHEWKKKKDGRTVGEAHERLKVGNVDALNCYYAHGEKNPFFQRRCYWMLDPVHEHIALVHYLDVSEGRQCGSNQTTDTLLNKSSTPEEAYEQCQSSCSPGSTEVTSRFDLGYSHLENTEVADGPKDFTDSSHATITHELHKLATELSLDGDDYHDVSVDAEHGFQQCSNHAHGPQNSWLPEYEEISLSRYKLEHLNDCSGYRAYYSSCDGGQGNLNSLSSMMLTELSGVDEGQPLYSSTTQQFPENGSTYHGNEPLEISQFNSGNEGAENLQFELAKAREFLLGPDTIDSLVTTHAPRGEEPTRSTSDADSNSETMQNKDPEDTWSKSVNIKTTGNAHSSLRSDFQFHKTQHIDPVLAAVSSKGDQPQFSIREICPEWAYSSGSTKVIITGDFLYASSDSSWSVMFGDIEVPLEIIQEGVLRCQAPKHHPGKVALCLTRGNGNACSEVREFEYVTCPNISHSTGPVIQSDYSKSSEELLLLIRFVQTLLESDPTSAKQEDTSGSETDMPRYTEGGCDWSEQLMEAALVGNDSASDIIDKLLQELLKDKLQQWILMKSRNCNGTVFSLSKQDSCILHLLSGLGYEWALNPILNSGVNVNFRDVRGWTALHWAAQFGREKMVASLLAAGALAGAVTDPSANDPVGKTPAAVAAFHGHKGLAGYLSEVALTTHLSSLTIVESENFKAAALMKADRAVEGISERTVNQSFGATEEQLSLKDSLAAVRNAAQAAARIQSAFRAHSFRKRQQKFVVSHLEYGMSQEEILGISKYQRSQHGARDQKYQTAALVIQKKFRGWKGRKSFLTLRQNAVKIQAHVRGYQVRKKYKFHMTVSILEKVILRWRRGGVGFRGFQTASASMDEIEDEDILKVFRKQKVDIALDEALTTVLSMAEYPEARQQYRRMLESYHHAKEKLHHSGGSTSERVSWEVQMENDSDGLSLSLEEAWAYLGGIDHKTL